jgi:hypothetical protein
MVPKPADDFEFGCEKVYQNCRPRGYTRRRLAAQIMAKRSAGTITEKAEMFNLKDKK